MSRAGLLQKMMQERVHQVKNKKLFAQSSVVGVFVNKIRHLITKIASLVDSNPMFNQKQRLPDYEIRLINIV